MNLKNYKIIDRRHIYPYPVYLVTPSYSLFLRTYLKIPFNRVIMIFNNGMWNCAIDLKEWGKSQEGMFRMYKKDPKIIDKFTKKFKKTIKKYLNFTKTLVKKDFSKLSNKDLLKLYKKYNQEYVKSFIYGECPAQALKWFLEEELKGKLLEIIKDEKKVNEIFSLLIMPSKDTFITKEEKDLLKIVLSKNVKEKLKKHTQKYNWISVDYNEKPMTIKDFENNLRKIKNPKQRLKELKNRKIKQEQLKTKKKHKIDNETFKLCIAAQKCVYLMDLKREEYSKAHYHVQFLMKEIGKRLGLSLRQADYLTIKEVEKGLAKNIKFNKKNLDKRYKKSVYIGDEYSFVVADKKQEAAIRKNLEKKIGKIKELKGICGNPGKVRAKARVILKTKDFPKFKKGEILVTAFTTPDFIVVMKKASGFVTDFGGITSHAAIVSRELKVPCIVGTEQATKTIKTGDLIEIDAKNGVVKKVK
jgi:phosphoenolpyruvate synthase/pyruvate phosphate dikinase